MQTKVVRREVDKQDFVVVKDRRTLDVTKVIAPHELQIGLEGYKRALLRIEGDERITGHLVIDNGCKGSLRLLDGTSAIKAGVGTIVTTGSDGSATVGLDVNYLASQQAGVVVNPTGGLLSAALPNGNLSLSINPNYLSSHLIPGAGVAIQSSNAGVTISALPPLITTTAGLQSSLVNGARQLSLNLTASSGITLTTLNSGQIQISSTINPASYAQLSGATFSGPVVAPAGLSGSLSYLADGTTPYIVGGAGVSVTTGSNGQVQVSFTGGMQPGTITDLAMNVTPVGPIDGSNTVFDLPGDSIEPSTFMLWLNGQLLTKDSDYSIAGNQLTFVNDVVPQPTDVIRAMYARQVATKIFALSAVPSQLNIVNDELIGVTLPQAPDPSSSLMLFLNGQLLTQGQDFDYSLNGSDVSFTRSLIPTDVIRATYSYLN